MLKRLLFWTAIICSLLHGGYHAKKTAAHRPRPRPPSPRPPLPSPPLVPSSEAAPVTEPTPTPRHSPSPPPIPVPLQPNQCSFGAENAYPADFQGHMETDVLYVLANHSADCAGFVDSLEFCYFYNTTEAKNSSYTIHLLSFRPQYNTSGDVQLYRKANEASVDVEADFFNTSKGDGSLCQVIEPKDRLSLSEGDVIGFATQQGLSIALMASDEKGIFQYVPSDTMQKQLSVQDLLQLESIPTAQLKQANNTASPVLKIVMNITETSSQILSTPIPTATKSPDPDMCNGNKNNHENTVSMLVFASVLAALAVVILALIVVVIILSCKICCNKKCLICHPKRQGAQKVSEITDQSMQYNELYLPADPAKARGGMMRSTKLHENPAYDLHTTSDRRELDHTYESIKFSHVSQS